MFSEKLSILVVLLVSYFIQTNADFFMLGKIKPDFLLLLTIYIAAYKGEFAGLWCGFLGGLLQDINLGGYIDLASEEMNFFVGTNALPKALIGYFFGKILMPYFRTENIFLVMLATFVSSLVKSILFLFIVSIFHQGFNLNSIIYIILPESLYNSLLAIFWFKLLKTILPIKIKNKTL